MAKDQRERTERREQERGVRKQQDREIEESPEIPEPLRPILRNMPAEQRQSLIAYIEHRGPLPPPWMLEQYKAVNPAIPDLFIRWFEQQQAHRQEMERKILPEQAKQSGRGQWLAFGSVAMFMGATMFLAYTGHDGVAMVTGGVTAVNTVMAFLGARKKD